MTPRRKQPTARELIRQLADNFAANIHEKNGCPRRRARGAATKFMERCLIDERRPQTHMKRWHAYWAQTLQDLIDKPSPKPIPSSSVPSVVSKETV